MRITLLLIGLTLLAGCGGSAGPSATSTPQLAAPPAPAVKGAEPTSQAAAKPAGADKPAEPSKPTASAPAPAEKPAPSTPRRATIAAPSGTSSYYAYCTALARLLGSKIPGLDVTVSEVGGTTLNAKRMQEDKADLGTGGFGALYLPYAGLDPAFKDQPLQDARALWIFDPAAQVWFVREDSGVTSIGQLNGKDFSAGSRGSATEVFARQLTFPVLGIQPKWYVGGAEDILAAMKDRRIVGMGKATALTRPDSVVLDAMTSMKIRMLTWTPEHVQQVKAKFPFLSTTQIPAGTYKADWNTAPVTTWQDGVGMFALARLDTDLAYQFTKAAVEDAKASDGTQAGIFKAMAGADLVKLTLELSTVPLHAGTQKYFLEVGAKIPDHLRSPEAR